MPSGTPMIPSGIWSSAKAKLKSDTAPTWSVVASEVTTMNVICVAPSPIARGAISGEGLARMRIGGIDPRVVAEPEPGERPDLDQEVAERAGDDAERQPDDAEARGQQDGRADDREVVDDRRHRRGGEPPARVEHAGRHRAQRQQDRAEQHDPRQLDGRLELLAREARRDDRHDDRREHEEARGEHGERDQHEVDDRRHDAPRPGRFAGGQQRCHDRHERRRERSRGDELEDQVGDAERREERVEVGRGAERVADDDETHVAEDARDQECARDDDPRAGERAGGGHGADCRRARGWASR